MTDNYMADKAETTMHEFKTHLSKYVRMMEARLLKAVIVKRGKKPVGLFIPWPDEKKQEAILKKHRAKQRQDIAD